ncbi:hypothetical protein ACIBF6_09360 [Streptosporangium amethystogenes]
MTNELIAGYANYTSTVAVLQEQQVAAAQPESSYSVTFSTASISLSWTY